MRPSSFVRLKKCEKRVKIAAELSGYLKSSEINEY